MFKKIIYSNEMKYFIKNYRKFSTNNKGYILCSDPIDKVCIDILQKAGFHVDQKQKLSKEELISIIPKYRGLIVRSETKVTADVMLAGKNLELIGRAGTGVDNIDMTSANLLGKVIMNTPGGNTISTAELTMSMILLCARNIPGACSSLKAGRWDRKVFIGTELYGKTIGIIGLGRIGREIAKWCQGFGMKVIGYDPIMSVESAREHGIEKVSLNLLYSDSDFITIHTPLNDETFNLINKQSIEKCKDGVRIINCARGGIVNESDLLEALNSGKVAAAGLDTFSKEPPTQEILELIKHPSVICTPHLGANTSEAQSKVAMDIAQQFVKAFDHNEYYGVVNARFMGLSKQPYIAKYLDLAERLGSILGQLMEGSLKKLTLNLYGKELCKDQVAEIVSNSALKGLLSHVIEDSLNLINSPYIAEEHGLKIKVNRLDEFEKGKYNDTIELILETENSKHILVGTLYHGENLRIIKLDDFDVEFNPSGNLIMFWNDDKPGVIASVSTCLSHINISYMSLGRYKNSAMGVITTDDPVDKETIDQLKKLPNMKSIKRIQLTNEFLISGDKTNDMPKIKPNNPKFGSGPCSKRPGYEISNLQLDSLGRSHRSTQGKSRIIKATEDAKRILGVPQDYSVGIVPGSDTGAVEMALWGLLSRERKVEFIVFDAFGKDWLNDGEKELKLDLIKHESNYGKIPDLSNVNTLENDIVFTWNGTTSGVRIPDGNWIDENRKGLTICDATSAAFAMHLPWDKLDITTFSWQKVLGGEGAHGMIIASPRAMKRFNESKNNRAWPIPKILRFSPDIFTGNVINTPSLLCIEDFIDALNWVEMVGGLDSIIKKSNENLAEIEKFVNTNNWISFLAEDKKIRSNTSICLKLNLNKEQLNEFINLLEKEKVAFDIGSYKSAPPGIRIWGGATVSSKDVQILMLWLKWAYEKVINNKK